MTPQTLRSARKALAWTQTQAASRLGVSQAYLAMLETGKRPLNPAFIRRAAEVYELPPGEVPPSDVYRYRADASQDLAVDLAALGYPGFAYLRPARWKAKNPAQVLLDALGEADLEARLVEALPWLAVQFAPFDDRWLVRQAKLRDLQNRLGFVVELARGLAERAHDEEKAQALRGLEGRLERSRLVFEDTLCKTVREPQRRWLAERRSESARRWNLLTDWTLNALRYPA
jgi:transcriptional regulator with XRE-family HTH domain